MTSSDDVIEALDVRGVNVPLPKPIRTAAGDVTSAPLVLLDLTAASGAVGHAYVFCYTAVALRALRILLDDIGTVVTGLPLQPRTLARTLRTRFTLIGCEGLVGMALAGIDIAAWDAQCIAAGVPLYAALGARRTAIPAYDSLGMMSVHDALEEGRQSLARGFKAIKYKISGASVQDDVTFVSTIRDGLGRSVELMVDYNQSLDRAQAVRRGAALEEYELAWIEEPCAADDDISHAIVARALRTPVQIGENWWGPSYAARSIYAQACDEMMVDVIKIGGITGWLDASALGQAAGLRISSHIFPEISAHLLSAAARPHFLEWLDLASPVLRNPLQPTDGVLLPSCEPGTGIAWNEDAVARYRVN